MLECEAEAVDRGHPERIRALLEQRGHPEIWQALDGTYAERSPSGGLHWYYRVTGGPVGPNTALAKRPSTAAELAAKPDKPVRVLVETRGKGGYSVVAPSGGTVHETGRPWSPRPGSSPSRMAELTVDQVAELHTVCRSLDEMPAPPVGTFAPSSNGGVVGVPAAVNGRPRSVGDDFNATHSCAEILTGAGWTCVGPNGVTGTRWRKPGATDGHHATLRDDGDRVKVFTTGSVIPESAPGMTGHPGAGRIRCVRGPAQDRRDHTITGPDPLDTYAPRRGRSDHPTAGR